MDAPTGEVTSLLKELRTGNKDAEAKLFALLYDELRRLAVGHLRRERRGHTLQPTALVNEAYLRLIGQSEQNWQNRAHFVGTCAHVMREVLVDYARRRKARKRGGSEVLVSLDEALIPGTEQPFDLLALHEALSRLEQLDARQSRIVELRYFGGLQEEEISHVLGISVRTVKREWKMAQAWLYHQLTK